MQKVNLCGTDKGLGMSACCVFVVLPMGTLTLALRIEERVFAVMSLVNSKFEHRR